MSSSATRPFRTAALAALAIVLGLVVLLALPPVQLRLVRLFASWLPSDTHVQLGYVWAGPRGVDLRDLHVAASGFAIDVARADVDLAFLSSLARLRLDISNARLDGVDVHIETASNAVDAGAPREPAPFAGLRPILRLPARLALREVTAGGTVTARAGREIVVAGPWRLAARGLIVGGTASTDLEATLDVHRGAESLATGAITVNATAQIDAASQITSATLTAEVQPVEQANGVRAMASLALEDASERYALTVQAAASGQQIAQLDAGLQPDGTLEADWRANLTPGVVAAFARGRNVADLSGTSTGHARIDLPARRAQFQTATMLEGQGWDAFDPRLGELGSLRAELNVDASAEPGRIGARRFELSIATATHGDVLRIVALQPLSLGMGSWLIDPTTWGEPALRVAAVGVPLRWLHGFNVGGRLQAGELSGALDVVRDGARRTTVVVTEPLRATGVQLAPVQDVRVPVFDVTLVPRATLSEDALDAEIEQLTITTASGLQVDFQGHAATSRTRWPVADFDGALTARVPVLQRMVPQLRHLRTTNRLHFDFSTLELLIAAIELAAEARDGRTLVAAGMSGDHPLRIVLPDFMPDWDTFEPQSVTLRLDRMPIDWLGEYIPELQLRGGEVSGRFTAAGGGGRGLTLQTHEPLVVANLTPVYRGRAAAQTWTASVSPRVSLHSSASSFALEDLTMRNAAGDRVRGALTIEASAGAPLALDLSLAADFPSLSLRVRHRGELEPELRRFAVHELTVSMSDAKDNEFLGLRNLRPFFITSAPFGVAVDGGSARILRASVTPLRLEDLLPSIFGFELEGLLPRGEFFGSAAADGSLVVRSEEPLVFSDVTVRWGEATLLDRVTTSVRHEVAYSRAGIEARSVNLEVVSREGELLARTTTQVAAPLTGQRRLSRARIAMLANLAPLSGQPVLADLAPFTAGTVEVNLELVDDGDATLMARGGLRGAVTAELGRLPDVELRVDAEGRPGERIALALPVVIESAEFGRSNLELNGAATKDARGAYDFDASLTGTQIVVADIERLVQMLSPRQVAPAAPQPARSELVSAEQRSAIAKLRTHRHSVPIWSDYVRGTARVDIERVLLGSFAVDDVRGRLDMSPERAALSGVQASMLGAALESSATIDFDAALPKPYTLALAASVADLAVERLFLTAAPDETPTAEGRFDLEIALNGVGLNPLDLGLSSLGAIRLSGRDGVFRGLAASAGTGSNAARAVGALTFSRELRAVGRLLDGLGELRFHEAEVELDGTAVGSMTLSTLRVVAPQLRIEGSGTLGVAPLQPLVRGPLDLSAQLAARGDIAVVFDGMKLLEEGPADDYRALTRPISIGGSPAEPDTEAFWELLNEGAANARGMFGFTLRTLNRKLERGRSRAAD